MFSIFPLPPPHQKPIGNPYKKEAQKGREGGKWSKQQAKQQAERKKVKETGATAYLQLEGPLPTYSLLTDQKETRAVCQQHKKS